MPKSWACRFCDNPSSEMGAYVKLSTKSYAHVTCFEAQALAAGIKQGRQQILDEQAAAERKKYAMQAAEDLADFNMLGRCPKCGVRMGPTRPQWQALGEVRERDPITGRCVRCVREEVQARAQARFPSGPTSAAQAIIQAPSKPVEPEEKDEPKEPETDTERRFKRIEID